ncbi:hypothetical protein [Phenylobacterium sp.]|jgi:hypothetical protein|uniref:hypothetical protein n=1 Tax=Phenylobacterium sp. TaxID=1871053 RepID=UPI003784FA5C
MTDIRDDLRADLREAYERGRRDERSTRKRHPLTMTIMVIAAVVGLLVLALAAINGSFSRAGGVVDQNLSVAVERAEPAVRGAAADASQSLRSAGEQAKSTAADAAN